MSPLYDFTCDKCGTTEEHLLRTYRSRGPQRCHETGCDGKLERQFPTGIGFKFIGEGFFAVDHAKPSYIRDHERDNVVAVTPKEQHMRRRRGIKP